MQLIHKIGLRFVAALVFSAPFLCQAGSLQPSLEESWLQRSMAILDNPSAHADVPTPVMLDAQTMQQAQDLANESIKRVQSDLDKEILKIQAEPEEKQQDQVYIFVTFGNPANKAKIRQLAAALSGEKYVVLAVRGLPAGTKKIDELITLFGQAIEGLKDPPGLVIDAQRFKDYQIEVSPTIMVEREGRPVVWAKGVSDPDWIRRKAQQGATGDLGAYGEVEKIAEISLFQTIAERIARIDWQKEKEEGIKRYWTHQKFIDYPTATEERAFSFEPAFQVAQDMTGPNGEVIARAGQVINPVAHIAGTFYLVLFDAGDKRQVQIAKQLGLNAPAGKRVKFIATSMEPGEDGWKEKSRIEAILNAPIYFLDQHQAGILRLQHVPSTVQTHGTSLLVREYPVQPSP